MDQKPNQTPKRFDQNQNRSDGPNRNQNQNGGQNNNNNRSQFQRYLPLLIIAVLFTLLLNSVATRLQGSRYEEITYDAFLQMVDDGDVSKVIFESDRIDVLPKDQASVAENRQQWKYTGLIPNVELNDLVSLLDEKNITYNNEIVEPVSPIVTFVVSWLLPFAIIYLLFGLLMRSLSKKMGAGGLGGMGGMGQSKAKVYMGKETGVTFTDVAGQDEAKESLVRRSSTSCTIRRNTPPSARSCRRARCWSALPAPARRCWPRRWRARPRCRSSPSPVRTLWRCSSASAPAGCGICSSRRRRSPPAIIFIDEIDAIGRTRDIPLRRQRRAGADPEPAAGGDRRLRFRPRASCILAATNRPEILDKALLRAGRFDRRIIVDRPNLKGRLPDAAGTHPEYQAGRRCGPATRSPRPRRARWARTWPTWSTRLLSGPCARAARLVNQEDLLVVLRDGHCRYGEEGHRSDRHGKAASSPITRWVTHWWRRCKSTPSPCPRSPLFPHTSGALGYTMQMPEEEKYPQLHGEELLTELQTLLGGRAAEQVVFGVQTTGAANDIQRATDLARKMVTQYGMSDQLRPDGPVRDRTTSISTAAAISTAPRRRPLPPMTRSRSCLQDAYEDAKQHADGSTAACWTRSPCILLQKETITGDELMAYVNADAKSIPDHTGDEPVDPA